MTDYDMLEYRGQMDINEIYPTRDNIEDVRRNGHEEIQKCADHAHKAHYLLNSIIWADYWNARILIESESNRKTLLRKIRGGNYFPGYILDIDHYTEHWLYANAYLFSAKTIKAIEENYHYIPLECRYMPKGYTIYIFHEPTLKQLKNNEMACRETQDIGSQGAPEESPLLIEA